MKYTRRFILLLFCTIYKMRYCYFPAAGNSFQVHVVPKKALRRHLYCRFLQLSSEESRLFGHIFFQQRSQSFFLALLN